ncbi:HNH endonuclease [Microbacterium sp.]|uniref:HNH endonuclease n=1 Tax=Microbacterium sp. TaxID=51671 RepID=UPI003458E337|nr:HNH endonuclease [Microbacterium sp.]MCV0374390.1 HNH endonuclease [Microbacterium sp.]MCV0389462.1 HNH endonuclease [Microbacterium sp.]MCV0418996.1 HNH endonuclease [Microbacterium sp.]MCV0421302.1 HNH endonuclease [Microbacterium sp.]
MVQEGRSSALRKKHRAHFARSKPSCHICGGPIDYSLKWPDPMCFVVDHLVAIANGGSDQLSNKAASHNHCNSKKRARVYAPIIRRSGTLE